MYLTKLSKFYITLSSSAVTAYTEYSLDKVLVIFTSVSLLAILPVAGVLADVFLSRYKVVSYSLRQLVTVPSFASSNIRIFGSALSGLLSNTLTSGMKARQ